MGLINQCIDYLKANPVLAIVLIAAGVLLLVVVVVMIVRSARKGKNATAKTPVVIEQTPSKDKSAEEHAKKEAAEEQAKKVEAEAARQATLARLEQERAAAEKEEAEKEAEKLAEKKSEETIAQAVAKRSEKEHAQKVKQEKAVEKKTLADDEDEMEKAARYSGKWTICRVVTDSAESDDEETYFFELHASNGEKLLSSEEYTSYTGALRGDRKSVV